jgi:twinkle protein
MGMSSGTAGIADFLGDHATAWAKTRGISETTLAALGVGSGTAFFPDAGQRLPAIFFRYGAYGGWKARSFPEKHFVAGGGFAAKFWNLEAVLAGGLTTVYLTEGELDACALVEAGIAADAVLSVPAGAREKPAGAEGGHAYAVDALKAGLSRCRRFVWCGDEDGPGHALRADMVRIFGAARFHFVSWPDGAKDACDLLKSDGARAVHDLVVDGALPWPVEGLYRLDDLPEPAPLPLWRPGFAGWEGRVKLAPRTLSVVTGHPGHGKTLLWAQIWAQVVRAYELVACIATWETRPKPHYRRQLRTVHSGALERDMAPEEVKAADRWINDRYLFLSHPDQRPTLGWCLDAAEVAVIRHGARILQIDPWNRFESARARDERETDYIGSCLKALHAFAHDLNVHVQIIAHPAKMEGPRRGKEPSLEDISGSKHWENMPDQGFTVHRPAMWDDIRKSECTLIQRKTRFEELGYPCRLELNYQHGTYHEKVPPAVKSPAEPQDSDYLRM